MLDIKFIRDNAEKIQETAKNKNISLDVNQLLELDKKRRELQGKLEELQKQRNEIAARSKGGKPTQADIEQGQKIKQDIISLEKEAKIINGNYTDLMVKVPTIPSSDTPIGKDESENVEIYKWGEPTKFDFTPKDHIALAQNLDLIDFERGVKVAGFRGYFLKNEAVSLQMACMMYALEKLIQKGFMPMIPPTLVREFALFGSGYFSGKEYNPQTDEIYKIENYDKSHDGKPTGENKFLVGTAEPSILAYYANEVLDEASLPLKLCGFSQCYRSEIGSYGKDTKGIYRVHEFMKVEQVCITKPDIAQANKIHEEMIAISKELHEDLGLPYRQLQICTGDMSAGKYKKYDIEAWIPSRNGYGETGSASNFLDWQARRLGVKCKGKDNKKNYVYMLNNTALPSARILIAILENYQKEDGSIEIPQVLRRFMPNQCSIINE